MAFRSSLRDRRSKRQRALRDLRQRCAAHDLSAVLDAFKRAAQTKGKPSVIVAKTVKGYPLDAAVLGKDANHHGKPLTEEEAKKAIDEIERMAV